MSTLSESKPNTISNVRKMTKKPVTRSKSYRENDNSQSIPMMSALNNKELSIDGYKSNPRKRLASYEYPLSVENTPSYSPYSSTENMLMLTNLYYDMQNIIKSIQKPGSNNTHQTMSSLLNRCFATSFDQNQQKKPFNRTQISEQLEALMLHELKKQMRLQSKEDNEKKNGFKVQKVTDATNENAKAIEINNNSAENRTIRDFDLFCKLNKTDSTKWIKQESASSEQTARPSLSTYSSLPENSSTSRALETCKRHSRDPKSLLISATIERGYIMKSFVTQDGFGSRPKIVRKTQSIPRQLASKKRPICFVYSGVGSQWSGAASHLMEIPTFRKSIKKCATAVEQFGIDLYHLLLDVNADVTKSPSNCFLSIAAMQIALTDVFRHLGILPDLIVGQSFGEITAAYADGCLTAEQVMEAVYWRGRFIAEEKLPEGAMVATGLTYDQFHEMQFGPDVYLACYNARNATTLSGRPEAIQRVTTQLNALNILATPVASAGIAFHSPLVAPIAHKWGEKLKSVIPNPIERSPKWVSTSITPKTETMPGAAQASSFYFINSLVECALLYDGIRQIPANAIVFEIAPHFSLKRVLLQTLNCQDNVRLLGVMNKRSDNNMEYILENLGEAYMEGTDRKSVV